MLSDFQYCIQLMLKNQANIKTHSKNFNDKYHDFHCIAFIGKLGHQLILNEFLEDGRTVCRHSNEGEVIDETTIILFLDVHVCKCIIFSLHFRPMTVTLTHH